MSDPELPILFIGYRFSGVPRAELDEMLTTLAEIFAQHGYRPYHSCMDDELFEREGYTTGQIMDHVFGILPKASLAIFLILSTTRSEGMFEELGALRLLRMQGCAIPYIIAIQNGVRETTSVHFDAHEVIRFARIKELYDELRRAKRPIERTP